MENITAEEMATVPESMTAQEYIPMLLMNTAFEPGTCVEFIESLTDPDVKKMAYAEYYYFSGQHEKAVEYAGAYLDHDNVMIQMSACLIYSFANLSLNHIHDARDGLNRLEASLALYAQADQVNKALLAFMGNASKVLLHLPVDGIPNMAEQINVLPEGMRLWGCYVMAHEAYLKQEYGQSLGVRTGMSEYEYEDVSDRTDLSGSDGSHGRHESSGCRTRQEVFHGCVGDSETR